MDTKPPPIGGLEVLIHFWYPFDTEKNNITDLVIPGMDPPL
jgi:hypothetical protein